MKLQLARIVSPVTVLGPGRRIGIWVQGCTLACFGCASRDTWDASGGTTLAVDEVVSTVAGLLDDDASLTGITLTGGEPLQQPEAVRAFLDGLGALAVAADRELDVLLFTGYSLDVARRRAPHVLDRVDATVAGPYLPDRPADSYLVGSANQRLEVLTPLGRRRFAADTGGNQAAAMQVSASGGDLLLLGIPRAGDLDRLRDRLALAGVEFEDVTWQS